MNKLTGALTVYSAHQFLRAGCFGIQPFSFLPGIVYRDEVNQTSEFNLQVAGAQGGKLKIEL